jgi:hypothetical protein
MTDAVPDRALAREFLAEIEEPRKEIVEARAQGRISLARARWGLRKIDQLLAGVRRRYAPAFAGTSRPTLCRAGRAPRPARARRARTARVDRDDGEAAADPPEHHDRRRVEPARTVDLRLVHRSSSIMKANRSPDRERRALKLASVKTAPADRACRTVRPRTPIAVAPTAISTENCLSVAGVMPWKFREALDEHPDIPRSRIGHTVIVAASDFLSLLERLRVDAVPDENHVEPAHQGDEDEGQPRSVDDVLAKIGREVAR